jgi:hypothetical protein
MMTFQKMVGFGPVTLGGNAGGSPASNHFEIFAVVDQKQPAATHI